MLLSERTIEIFREIAKVPRQSKHEERIASWLVQRAQKNGFDVTRDSANNVIMRIPASKGYEQGPVIILQGHMDMVCEKTPDSPHNFDADPIEVIIEDGWMHANKTSLGADDGLGVALALAIAEDPDVEHPALEILITSDEETGMTGANALNPDDIKGRILLNLDSEDEGIFTIGCAGGRETTAALPLADTALPQGMKQLSIHITGLLGGHSGCEIEKGRASAIKLTARLLDNLVKICPQIWLVSLNAGSAHNAIPRDALCRIALPAASVENARALIQNMAGTFSREYQTTDPGITVETQTDDISGNAFTPESLRRAIDLLLVYPHGVCAMNHEIDGLVETSDNLASLSIKNGALHILSSQRSSVASKLNAITSRIEASLRLAGAQFASNAGYPAWQPDPDADVLKRCVSVYNARFGKNPIVNVIHAGLECGIIGNKIPGMQMVSFGPTVVSPHSPKERAEIKTIDMTANFLVDLLKTYR